MRDAGRTLLYLITEDWFFRSHFRDRARAARDAGWSVVVMTRPGPDFESLTADAFDAVPVDFDRSGLNPLRDARTIAAIVGAYRRIRPAIVHHIAMKPIIYGSLAARLAGVPHVVNAPVGMGFLYAGTSARSRALRPLAQLALKAFLNPRGSAVVFENRDDFAMLTSNGFVRPDDAVLIRGAGIDLDAFPPTPEPAEPVVVTVTARMLWDKGIGEFVEAARRLRAGDGQHIRFQLAGAPDPSNPASIPQATLEGWQREGVVTWLGHRSDVASLLAASHVVCLPSYREGLPKSLLEAMAAGRPIVTTDVPGCREAVLDGENGFLVPPRNAEALAEKLKVLASDAGLRRRFGARGRQLAEENFSIARISAETLALYDRLAATG